MGLGQIFRDARHFKLKIGDSPKNKVIENNRKDKPIWQEEEKEEQDS